MRNPVIKLGLRLAITLFCICITHSPHYSQTNEGVVKLRLSFELQKAAGVLFSPVSKLLAVRREDGSVKVIDITDGREQATLPLTNKEPLMMQWTADGLRLLVINSKFAALWDPRLGSQPSAFIKIPRDKHFVLTDVVELSPNETTLLSVKTDDSIKTSFLYDEKKIVRVWDVASGQLRFEIQIKGFGGRAQFSPDGKQLLTTSDSEDARLWDVETCRLQAKLTPPVRRLDDGSSGIFRPDGKVVAVHSHGIGIYLWDCATGLLKTTVALDTFTNRHSLAGFSPDGKLLAIYGSNTAVIEMRDSETAVLGSTLTVKNIGYGPDQLLWSSDSRTLIRAAGRKYEAKSWDVTTGQLKATFPVLLTFSRIPFDFGSKDIDLLSIHPTLPIVSAANEKFVRLWNSETGELLQRLEGTGRPAHWSADGKLLLTFAKDLKSASVWESVLP